MNFFVNFFNTLYVTKMKTLSLRRRPVNLLNQQLEKTFSPCFQTTHRATGMIDACDFLTEHRNGGPSLVSLSKTTTSPEDMILKKALKQKKEILEWLSDENPSNVDLLTRLSQCSTPYARLFKRVAEEMEVMIKAMRSGKLDDLDRESSLTSAKLEVEIQQQRERVSKIKADTEEIQSKLKRGKQILNRLNGDIDRLQTWATYNLNTEEGRKTRREEFVDNGEWEEPAEQTETVKLDTVEYQGLWTEQQQLTNSLQVLANDLRQKQLQQLEEMRAYVKRKNPRFMTRL